MSVPPWSHSRLDAFISCPRKFHGQYVTKQYTDPPGEKQLYGTRVHLDFEHNQAIGAELPDDLKRHQPFMDEIRVGKLIGVERKVALNKRLEPCEYFDKDVWWRGVIDLHRELQPGHCRIVDYKTGKPHSKMHQLHEYAVYAFAEGYERAEVMYYWTQNMNTTKLVFTSISRDALLRGMAGDLMQYATAFKTDIWRPRKNGLCKDYCPVKDCEYYGGGAKLLA